VNLEFTYSTVLNNGAGAAKSVRYRPTAVYDVDPVLGSTSTPGFSEFAAFYQFYRTHSYSYEIDVVSKETFPMLAIVTNSNVDPGTTGIGTYMGNPYTESTLLSGNAGGPCTKRFVGRYRIVDVVGSIAPETDDSFASLVNTVPTNNTFVTLGIDGIGSTITNGVTYLLKIRMGVRFYERKILAT
jgi:hypothetical protein